MKVLITGVSSGIGKATCEALIQKNIHVLGVSRNASQISFNSSLYTPYDLNLAKCSQIQKPLEQIQKEHPDIDILICNAGKGLFGSLEEYSYHAMQELMNLNFLSHAILSKVFIPNMKKKKKGKIVFIASEAALQGRQ